MNPADLSDRCAEARKVAEDAARKAGEHMLENFGKAEVKVEKTKATKDDLVTVVDKQCQKIIETMIKEAFPEHELLGEEDVPPGSAASVEALEKSISHKWLWVVDPIDGTQNFVHRRPASVVSIALAYNGDVQVGVIYDPYRNEMFSGQKGNGAFLNDVKMSVDTVESFSAAVIGFGIGVKRAIRDPMLRSAAEFSSQCRGIRLQGSAALELAWVSCGRQTGFFELDLNAWDIAAGALLVLEAGGRVTDTAAKEFTLRTRHIVASNSLIHHSMLKCIETANATGLN